jgi:hypothetical protein
MAWIDEILRFVAHARKPDGSLDECRLDGDGNLRVTFTTDASEPAWDDSPGFVASRVVKAGASTLFHLGGLCDSEGYLLVFDANAVPVNGTKCARADPRWRRRAAARRAPPARTLVQVRHRMGDEQHVGRAHARHEGTRVHQRAANLTLLP